MSQGRGTMSLYIQWNCTTACKSNIKQETTWLHVYLMSSWISGHEGGQGFAWHSQEAGGHLSLV